MTWRFGWVNDGGKKFADTRDRTRDLQIFSLTLSQLSYIGNLHVTIHNSLAGLLYSARGGRKNTAGR